MGSNQLSFSAEAPQFFKFIHSDIVKDKRLRIPKKFMRKYGKTLSDRVLLQVPSGAAWQVESINSNAEVWLQKGWQEFVEHYCIGLWHFLVFIHEGNSHFHVLIFDTSASEIEYPVSTTHSEMTNLNGVFQVGTEVIEIGDCAGSRYNFPTSKATREKSPLSYPQPYKKSRINLTCEGPNLKRECRVFNREESARDASEGIHANRMKPVKSEDGLYLYVSMQEVGVGPNFAAKGGVGRLPATHRCPRAKFPANKRNQLATDTEKARAIQSAKDFKSKKPFFMVTIQASYVCGRSNTNIPRIFVERYITKQHNNADVLLQVLDGGTWLVKCIRNSHDAKFNNGWSKFARDNYLAVGDVCVFELINDIDNLLKVVIFRASKDANC